MSMYPYGPPQPPVQIMPKSPGLAVFLSFLIPGLGSMTSGSGGIGAIILAVYVFGWLTAWLLIGIPIILGAWIWGMIHAHGAAVRWNREHGIVS